MLAVVEGVLGGEDAAPGVAEQHEVRCVQAEGDSHLLDLVDKSLQGPQGGVLGHVAAAGTELVVVHVLDPALGR